MWDLEVSTSDQTIHRWNSLIIISSHLYNNGILGSNIFSSILVVIF